MAENNFKEAGVEQKTSPSLNTANTDGGEIEIQGVVDRPLAGLSLSEEAFLVKKKLASEEKIPFFIPLDPGERKGAYRSVTINGYRCEVKKNVMVPLPKSIVTLLMQSMQMESDALNSSDRNLSNVDEETRKALNA